MLILWGSYHWLTVYPLFQTVTVLGLISIGAMFFIRDFFEGLAYNTSRCALWGGSAVLGVIAIGIDVLQEGIIPPALASGTFHLSAGVVSAMIAVINVRTLLRREPGKKEQVMDLYHNWVLLPGYIYLILTLIPLIFLSGSWLQCFFLVLLIIVYALTALHDINTRRLDQQKFLRDNGLYLPIRD